MTLFPYKIIDLTHDIHEEIPYWGGRKAFQRSVEFESFDNQANITFRVSRVSMMEGLGTHIDSPLEIGVTTKSITELDLNDLIAPCIVIDVHQSAHERYSISIDDIKNFEERYGVINAGSFVIVRTGWAQYWNCPEKYVNNHLFPSVSSEAAILLLEREIVGLGIDTLSPDRPEDGHFVHKLLLGAHKYIVENIANVELLPPVGAFTAALPIKLKGSAEAPVRLIGLVDNRIP